MFTAIMLLKLTTAVFTLLTLTTALKAIDMLMTHKEMRESGKDIFQLAKRHSIKLKTLNLKRGMCVLLRPFMAALSGLLLCSTGFVFVDLLTGFSGFSQSAYMVFLFMGLGGYLYMDWLKSLLHRDILTMQYNFNLVLMEEKLKEARMCFDDLMLKVESMKSEEQKSDQ